MRSYRQITWMFLGGGLLLLLLLAAFNVATSRFVREGTKSWWDPGVAFSADSLTALASRALYPLGISIDPSSTVIGKDGWLFLGDRYNASVSIVRRTATRAQRRNALKVGEAITSWRDWLSANGVTNFWVMVAPDKDDVYPGKLPDWVKPVAGNAQDAIRHAIDPTILIDAALALNEQRSVRPDLLFRMTDTHWSNWGAWLATDAFFKRAAAADDTLTFPKEVTSVTSFPTPGSDLANFLRLQDVLTDEFQQVMPVDMPPPQLEQTTFDAPGVVPAPGQYPPKLTHNAAALNHRRLLWLHDSFGEGMAPYVRGALVEFHIENGAVAVGKLVEQFKPQMVLVTVVDRQTVAPLLSGGPPGL